MHYEDFSRHLREKYSTRLHVADQLVDQLKHRKQVPTSMHELNIKNLIKAQKEITFPLISHLNKFEDTKVKSTENTNEFEPYFNECLLAAERIKNNRRSNRDRQICYENLILTEKLERIKRLNVKKAHPNHRQLLLSKANFGYDDCKSIQKNPLANQQILDPDEEKSFETIITCYSSSPNKSESHTSSSEHEDDQATAADVDVMMEDHDLQSPIAQKQRNKLQMNRNFNCAPLKSTNSEKQREDDRIYQQLDSIDRTMLRDTKLLPTSKTSRHFSVCILPRSDLDMVKPINHRAKVLSSDRQYAFKKEILYH